MRSRTSVVSLLFILTTIPSFPLSAAGPEGNAAPPHLAAAERVVKDIDPDHNEYAHRDCYLHWKGENGLARFENRTDCSDFVNLLWEHVYGFTAADYEKWTGHRRPTARVWHETLLAGKGFREVKKIADAMPGDVLAVSYPAGEKEDTGHVMIVAAAPKRRAPTAPLEAGTTQWEVPVIDSSKSGHGTTDTRHRPDGTSSAGVGRGVLRLYADESGQPAGYTWSTLSRSEFFPQSRHNLVIGRLEEPARNGK